MKICVITGMYPTPLYPSGGVFVVRRIAALQALGCQVDAFALVVHESWAARKLRTILHRWPNEDVADWISTDNPSVQLRAIRVHMNLIELVLNMLFQEKLFIRKAQKSLHQIIGPARYDVIHGHWLFPTGGAVVRYAQSVHTPCVVTAHGSEVHRDMRKKYRKGCLWTLENCTRAEFVSHALLQTAMQYGYSGRNAQVLPNGILQVPEKVIRKKGTTIGFVGNLNAIKRVEILPAVFHRVVQELPDTQMVIVGDGPLENKLKKELTSKNVRFTGRLSQAEVFQEMLRMDVLILPSKNEGWPCVVIEAHSCGVSVVGSSNGGIPESIGDERLLVAEGPTFEQDFAQRIIDVFKGNIPIDTEALRERAKTFTWEALQQQELKNYLCLR